MTIQELSRKDVIRARSGENLGRVDDICFDTATARIRSVILRGRGRLFGLMGREEDLEIPWEQINSIGADVIMVDTVPPEQSGTSREPLY
ncbi:MAG: PRC-barrel domain-containing protein [Gemmiger sp.]